MRAPERAAIDSARPVRTIAGRNLSKADLRVVELEGRVIAVKDYRGRPFFARHTAGRLFVGRECRAYAAAAGVPGLPEFLGRVDTFALATAWVNATPLSEIPPGSVTPEVFDRLDAILAALHARGVALGDLHHRDVLVTPSGEVALVDLATAVVAGPYALSWRRAMFERLGAHDRLAAARLRARYTGRPESESFAAVDPAAVRRHAAGRRIKALWDALRGKRA
jgi:hypothetical protein